MKQVSPDCQPMTLSKTIKDNAVKESDCLELIPRPIIKQVSRPATVRIKHEIIAGTWNIITLNQCDHLEKTTENE